VGNLINPFWLSTVMDAESVVFVGDGREPIAARLLFQPDTIVSVTNAAADVRYVEGDDYYVDRHAARIIRVPGSRMPWTTREAVASADGQLTHGRTVAVTYSHASGQWRGFVPANAGTELPRTTRRLQQREPLTICVTGDSISEGYDASAFHALPPFQPPFAALAASALQQSTSADVRLHNFGTAGWTTRDALWDTERITAVNPDLVVVAFGMNDASYAEADEYGGNVSRLVAAVRADVAHAEFILVAPMLPTPECDWVVHARFAQYRDVLAQMSGEGVALADVTTLWTDLLARKDPHDLSGNGWNHPNDFGHRIYAQTILAVMGCPPRRGGSGSNA
jgi:lysophospholipase L1-like esterase